VKKFKKNKTKKPAFRESSFSVESRIKIAASVKDLAEPLCESEGVELVYVEYQPEAGGMILRLYIDKPEGVTVDDCIYISRQLGDILDVNLENAGAYRLEVSSPGSDRPPGYSFVIQSTHMALHNNIHLTYLFEKNSVCHVKFSGKFIYSALCHPSPY